MIVFIVWANIVPYRIIRWWWGHDFCGLPFWVVVNFSLFPASIYLFLFLYFSDQLWFGKLFAALFYSNISSYIKHYANNDVTPRIGCIFDRFFGLKKILMIFDHRMAIHIVNGWIQLHDIMIRVLFDSQMDIFHWFFPLFS